MLQKYKMICFRQDYEAVGEENIFCYGESICLTVEEKVNNFILSSE